MCLNPIEIINKNTNEKQIVSCRKCILCRRKKCREWALKLYHESQYYKKMCMVTLTFRPKFLLTPKIKELTRYHTHKKPNGETIKVKERYETMISPNYITDVKKTGWLITLFIKKLRKKLSENDINISYFAVGEHGTQNTKRAHWHIIFFGIDKNTLNSVPIGMSNKRKEIYFSPIIDEYWSYDKVKIGNHTISDVTGATIKYVANYTMKKMYKTKDNNYPTIMRCSSHNKIGKKWARRYHKELRKEYLEDNEKNRYSIPESYYKEMKRFENLASNESMNLTAMIIEYNKDKLINRLSEKGLLSDEEIKKKAKKLEYYYSKQERDTI